MKKVILILASILLFSCGNSNKCEYSHLAITSNISGKMADQKKGNDCYSITKEGEGVLTSFTVQGEGTSDKFSINYFEEGDIVEMEKGEGDILRFLNINIGNYKSEWRADKGHQIFKIEKPDTLIFYFSEASNKKEKVSGTIVFSK